MLKVGNWELTVKSGFYAQDFSGDVMYFQYKPITVDKIWQVENINHPFGEHIGFKDEYNLDWEKSLVMQVGTLTIPVDDDLAKGFYAQEEDGAVFYFSKHPDTYEGCWESFDGYCYHIGNANPNPNWMESLVELT